MSACCMSVQMGGEKNCWARQNRVTWDPRIFPLYLLLRPWPPSWPSVATECLQFSQTLPRCLPQSLPHESFFGSSPYAKTLANTREVSHGQLTSYTVLFRKMQKNTFTATPEFWYPHFGCQKFSQCLAENNSWFNKMQHFFKRPFSASGLFVVGYECTLFACTFFFPPGESCHECWQQPTLPDPTLTMCFCSFSSTAGFSSHYSDFNEANSVFQNNSINLSRVWVKSIQYSVKKPLWCLNVVLVWKYTVWISQIFVTTVCLLPGKKSKV